MIRQQIVDFALAQAGKPYAEHGWGPKAYDCLGLVATTGIKNGVLKYDRYQETDPRFRNYSTKANPTVLLAAIKKYLVRVSRDGVLPGDVLLFRDPKAQHFGVVTKVNPLYVVHASLRHEMVRHQRVTNAFYVVCGWRYPGVNDG